MDQFVTWLIEGLPFGCVYALIAVGLVLTYKTTGVFNLAFSAQAFLSGAVYVQLVERNGEEPWFGFVIAVLVVAPLVGFCFDRFLFRYMRTASWQVKLVSVLGLFIAIPEIVKVIFGRQPEPVTPAASLSPLFGLDEFGGKVIFGRFVGSDYLVTAGITIAVVVLLTLLFRYTATGLQMRAVVESPRMVELAGVDSDRVSAVSWMLSSTLAGLAGVLLAPLTGSLDANIYTLLIIVCIAAAAIGRLQSIPLAFVGGLLLGVVERATPSLLDDVFGISSSDQLAKDIRPSIPFLVLFLVLVFSRQLRRKREATDPLAGVDPPAPAMAHTYKSAELQRVSQIAFPIFVGGFIVVMLTLVSDLWVFRITDAFTLAVVFLSITIFTGLGGQISLAQATFAGIGGFMAANLAADHGIPILAGVAIGAAAAAVVGALLALPVMRLAGIYLTLATLAFALMFEQVVFNREEVSNSTFGIEVPRPEFAQTDRTYFLLVFGIFAVVGFAVILIRKGTTGRYLGALRGSEVAAASIGINATRLRVVLFALSAAVAGIGGGLIAMLAEDVRTGESPTFATLLGIAWVVLVVTLGSRTVDGAVNAALGFVVVRWLLEDALLLEPGIYLILFGLGAITYSRHPEGIVEYQTRKSIMATMRARALNARARALAAAGSLPRQFTPVARVLIPAAAGPVLYFAYLLARSAIEGDWATVHSTTLLCFIVPSVVFVLGYMLYADAMLRAMGARREGPLVMLGGAALGALVGIGFQSGGDMPGSGLDCALVGLAAGAATVMFIWVPLQAQRAARAKGWLDTPVTWREGRASALFVLFGAFLFHRTTGESAPSGWPLCFVAAVFTIVWLQWIATVQGGINELAIGAEGEARRAAKGDVATAPDAPPTPIPASAGGGS